MATSALDHARRLLRRHILIDGHNDLPWTIRNDPAASGDVAAYQLRRERRGPDRGHTDFPRARRGGLGGQFWSVYVPATGGPDAHGFVHWLAVNLAPGAALAEGASGSPAAGVEGGNDFGRTGYGGPCPPGGEHRYVIEAFALSAQLELKPGYSEDDLRRQMASVTLGRATLNTRYRRAR